MFVGGQPRPHLRGIALYLCPNGLTYSDKIPHTNICGQAAWFYGVSHIQSHPKWQGPQHYQIFWDLPTCAHMVWPWVVKGGSRWDRHVFSGSNTIPNPRVGPQWPQFFDLLCAHGTTKSNQILHGDQTRWEKNFTGSTMLLFCDSNADARSVCST